MKLPDNQPPHPGAKLESIEGLQNLDHYTSKAFTKPFQVGQTSDQPAETCPRCQAQRTYYDGWNCPTEGCDQPASAATGIEAMVCADIAARQQNGIAMTNQTCPIDQEECGTSCKWATKCAEHVEAFHKKNEAAAAEKAMTETPETDLAVRGSNGQWSFGLRDLCQSLERQRDAYAETLRQIAHEDLMIPYEGDFNELIRERHPELASGSGEGSTKQAP